MPYDPAPFGPAQRGRDELPIIVAAGSGEPEGLILVGRPSAGRVSLRQWSGGEWGSDALERTVATDALIDELDDLQRSGRRLNQSLYAIRLWLSGTAG